MDGEIQTEPKPPVRMLEDAPEPSALPWWSLLPERILLIAGFCMGILFMGYAYIRFRSVVTLARLACRRVFRRRSPPVASSCAYDSDDEGMPEVSSETKKEA